MAGRGQRADAATADAVALSLLRLGTDTAGPRLLRTLLESSEAGAPIALIDRLAAALPILPAERGPRIARARRDAASAIAKATAHGVRAIAWHDAAYPGQLLQIPDPPIVLWVRGVADLARPAVAVVGSRGATPAGILMARSLGRDLAAAGLAVVSGLARGVDAAAHLGALDAGGRTIGILGGGTDVVYPPEHRELARRIAESGAVVSEFPPGTPPLARHFPLRNRIISGLSRGVVLIEASDRSGSLITARAALEQGRDVMAVPGNVASGRSRGCHALIKDGARLVESVDDVLEEIGWAPAGGEHAGNPEKSLPVSALEAVMAVGEAYSVDELSARARRDGPGLLAELGVLELQGRIRRTPAGWVREA